MNKLFSKLALESEALKLQQEVSSLQKSELITTEKILIENNRMLLPSQPDGQLVFNAAMVYGADGVVEIYDEISVEQIEQQFFAKFDDAVTDVNGRLGVVSYLSKVVAA
jgi:hypothetical protein